MKAIDAARIRALPKAELHLHLEGAIPLTALYTLVRKYGGEGEVPSLEALARRFVYTDFEHFIRTWIWKNKFLREHEDFDFIAYEVVRALHDQGVVYVEPFVSAGEHRNRGLDPVEVVRATLSGLVRGYRDFGIGYGLIVDLVRDFGPEQGMAWLRSFAPLRAEGVVGIGLGGSEHRFPARLFQEVYAEARRLDFHLTAHAGEAAGPESVWEAIDLLGVERVGHGVRAIEDPRLVAELARRGVPLELCPVSNLRTGVVTALARHPIRELLAAGVRVTVNSDDPTLFGTSLVGEYLALHRELSFTWPELVALARESFAASFADAADRAAHVAALERVSGLDGRPAEGQDGLEGHAMATSDKPGDDAPALLPPAGPGEAGHVASRDELLRILHELRDHLPQAGLDEDTARILDHDLKVAEEHAQGVSPKGIIISTRVSGVGEVLKHTGEAVEHVQTVLLPLVRRAADFAMHLFQ